MFIVYDSDLADNPGVAYAEWYAAEALTAKGATVKVVRLPHLPGGAKCGLDDYLVANGPDAFRGLLAAAVPPARPPAPLRRPTTPSRPTRPTTIRTGWRESTGPPAAARQVDGKTTWQDALVYHAEEYLRWSAGAYRPMGDKEVKAGLTASIKKEFDHVWRKGEAQRRQKQPAAQARRSRGGGRRQRQTAAPVQKVTGPLVRDVAQALASVCLIPSAVEPPAWLAPAHPRPASEVLSAPNGLLHLPSLVAGKDAFAPLTPTFFTRDALDYGVSLDAPAPSA